VQLLPAVHSKLIIVYLGAIGLCAVGAVARLRLSHLSDLSETICPISPKQECRNLRRSSTASHHMPNASQQD
jgi:hypothetical protein